MSNGDQSRSTVEVTVEVKVRSFEGLSVNGRSMGYLRRLESICGQCVILNSTCYDPQSTVNQQHDYEWETAAARARAPPARRECKWDAQISDSESKNGDHSEADIPEEEWCEQTDTNESRA